MSSSPGDGSTSRVDLDTPALLAFRGPDALRFLNGQVTQDVRLLTAGGIALPSCVTDAKGRLQFRIWMTAMEDGSFWVEGPKGLAEPLEARITRYLIADEVEVEDLTGKWSLVHFTTAVDGSPPEGAVVRSSARFGMPGTDWWLPCPSAVIIPEGIPTLAGDDLEAFRIGRGIPVWGRELKEGLLVPETGLETTDVSYQKGCYIGQEVISRIKSAGKLNQRLTRFSLDPAADWNRECPPPLEDAEGKPAGFLTSISPVSYPEGRAALGFLKRGTGKVLARSTDGKPHLVIRHGQDGRH